MWDRIALYGGGLVVVSVLLWAGFVREPSVSMRDGIKRSLTLINDKNYKDAHILIARLRKDHPKDVRGLHLEAYCLETQGDLPLAQDRYRESLALCENDDQRRHVMIFIADIDRRMGKLDRSEKYLDMAVKQYGASSRSKTLVKLIANARASMNKPVKDLGIIAEESNSGGVDR